MKYYITYNGFDEAALQSGAEVPQVKQAGPLSLHEMACFIEKNDIYENLIEVIEGQVVDNAVVVDIVGQLLGKDDYTNRGN